MKRFTLAGVLFLAVAGSLYSLPSKFLTLDFGDPRVRGWDPVSGEFLGDAVSLTDGGHPFGSNSDIEFDGQYYYTIAANDPRIRRFNQQGAFLGDFAVLTDWAGVVTRQVGLAYDGTYFYTIAANDERVRRFDRSGNFLGDFAGLRDSAGFVRDQIGIATDGHSFYTIAANDYRVRQFTMDGLYVGDFVRLTDGGLPFGRNTGLAAVAAPEVLSPLALLGALLLLAFFRRGVVPQERRCG